MKEIRFLEANELKGDSLEKAVQYFIKRMYYKDYARIFAKELVCSFTNVRTITVDIHRTAGDKDSFMFLLRGHAMINDLEPYIRDIALISTGAEVSNEKDGSICFFTYSDIQYEEVTFPNDETVDKQTLHDIGKSIELQIKSFLERHQDLISKYFNGNPEYIHEAFYAYHRLKETWFYEDGTEVNDDVRLLLKDKINKHI